MFARERNRQVPVAFVSINIWRKMALKVIFVQFQKNYRKKTLRDNVDDLLEIINKWNHPHYPHLIYFSLYFLKRNVLNVLASSPLPFFPQLQAAKLPLTLIPHSITLAFASIYENYLEIFISFENNGWFLPVWSGTRPIVAICQMK